MLIGAIIYKWVVLSEVCANVIKEVPSVRLLTVAEVTGPVLCCDSPCLQQFGVASWGSRQ